GGRAARPDQRPPDGCGPQLLDGRSHVELLRPADRRGERREAAGPAAFREARRGAQPQHEVTVELPSRGEAARPDGLELLGYSGLAAAAGILALGALERPSLVLLIVLGGTAVVVLLLRPDLALLLVVATAPLEGAFSSGPAGISVTKLTGGLLFASFLFSLARGKQRLVFERGQALVLGILALALLPSLQAQDTSA